MFEASTTNPSFTSLEVLPLSDARFVEIGLGATTAVTSLDRVFGYEALYVGYRDRKEVQQLIELGKQKGHLTYDEINEALPSDVFSSDQIDELMGELPSYLQGIVRQATLINAAVHQQYIAYPIDTGLA